MAKDELPTSRPPNSEPFDSTGEATKFLTNKTKGKRVFLKYDNIKHDSENNLLCYLYLENKTFLNAHCIKNGLVQVDISIDFKYREKFLKLLNIKDLILVICLL